MIRHPAPAYQITRDFEQELCRYTGAHFALAVNSGSAALLLALQWWGKDRPYTERTVHIPKHTYVSVPMAASHATCPFKFIDMQWRGAYQLFPSKVWDCARRFTSGMYIAGQFQCVSFAASKILAAEQGGAILYDDREADAWLRRMRFDGRTEGVDPSEDAIQECGWHCIMMPSVAAGLLVRLHHLPKHNPDMGPHDYPDLSLMPAFR